jgi:hypothetical protein
MSDFGLSPFPKVRSGRECILCMCPPIWVPALTHTNAFKRLTKIPWDVSSYQSSQWARLKRAHLRTLRAHLRTLL